MTKANRRFASAAGFTAVELVAVVAALAMLALLLLPALGHTRDGARTVTCQTTLAGFGQGMQNYANDNQGYLPGVNTSGFAVKAKMLVWNTGALNSRTIPVQSWDWMTPLLQDDPNLPDNRAARFHYLYAQHQCPEQTHEAVIYSGSTGPDLSEFPQYDPWPACSYLMPAYFQLWGQSYTHTILGYVEGVPLPIYAQVPPASFEVVNEDYQSHIDQVGPAARKIFVADGTRYVDATGLIDIDVSPASTWFGAFGSYGAWWSGSTEYGVVHGSYNWCDQIVTAGSPSNGLNLPISYRHAVTLAPPDPQPMPGGSITPEGTYWGGEELGSGDLQSLQDGTAQHNLGYINAVFFDGHVERLNDQQSREIEYWYPTGSVVNTSSEGMTCVPNGTVIP